MGPARAVRNNQGNTAHYRFQAQAEPDSNGTGSAVHVIWDVGFFLRVDGFLKGSRRADEVVHG